MTSVSDGGRSRRAGAAGGWSGTHTPAAASARAMLAEYGARRAVRDDAPAGLDARRPGRRGRAPRPRDARQHEGRARQLEGAPEDVSRTSAAPAGRDSRSARRAGAVRAAAQACRPAPGAGARRRTARGRPVGRPYGKSTAARASRRRAARSPSVGTHRFSSPKATSSPARPITTCASEILEQEPGSVTRRPARVDARRRGACPPSWRRQRDPPARPARRAVSTCRLPTGPSSRTRSPGSIRQVDAAQRPVTAARMAQPPAARLDSGRCAASPHGAIVGGQCPVTPRAGPARQRTRARTPVAASARSSSQPPTPAISGRASDRSTA